MSSGLEEQRLRAGCAAPPAPEVRQLFWAGWADELAKNLTEADHFGPAWHRVLHLWCEEADHPEPFCPGGSREAPDVAEFRRRVDNEFPDMAMS